MLHMTKEQFRLGNNSALHLTDKIVSKFRQLDIHHRLRFKRGAIDVLNSLKSNVGNILNSLKSAAPSVFAVGANAVAQFGAAVQAGMEMDFDFTKKQMAAFYYLGGGEGVNIGEFPAEVGVSANFYHSVGWKQSTKAKNIWDAVEGWSVGASVGVSIPTPWPGVGVSIGGVAGFGCDGMGQAPKFGELITVGVSGGVGVSPFDAKAAVDVAWVKFKAIKKTDCSGNLFPKTCMLAQIALSPLAGDLPGLAMAGGLFLVNSL
jgi:hypothetical protein